MTVHFHNYILVIIAQCLFIISSHVVMVDLTVDDEEDDEEEDKELRDKDAILIGDGSDDESEVNAENKDGAPSVVLRCVCVCVCVCVCMCVCVSLGSSHTSRPTEIGV